jgi:rhodanese-related sulfurtransferase
LKKFIIDVREPSEYLMGHVAGAINIPPSKILTGEDILGNIPRDAEIILYCRSGSRSNVAMNILRSFGYTNVVNGINKEVVNAKFVDNIN